MSHSGPNLPVTLTSLWAEVERLNAAEDPGGLPPVVGGGLTTAPRLACVFINPTARNASVRSDWSGPRQPWVGTRPVWKVFAAAGLLDGEIARRIADRQRWDEAFAAEVYSAVEARGLYLTNLVKWTGPNGDLPSPRLVRLYDDVLVAELAAVKPVSVVAFGGMTVKALTGRSIRLSDVLEETRRTSQVPGLAHKRLPVTVYPCFFPVGRGNPRGATELLTVLRKQLSL